MKLTPFAKVFLTLVILGVLGYVGYHYRDTLIPGRSTQSSVTPSKVDLAAADCGATSTPGFDLFCGTSAAAPTAAAIAALVKSAKPTATRAQVTAAMLNSTIDNEKPGTGLGAGIVMAPALIIQSMLVAKTARPDEVTEAFTWSASALLCGVGIGVATGGGLLEHFSSPAVLATGSAAALIAAAAAALIRRG